MTPKGRGFHRYNFDGYGEKADGSDYNGSGIGRLWPLLSGERGHYELAASNAVAVNDYIRDGNPPSGQSAGDSTRSATPLAWSHADYIRLLRSKMDGQIVDTPKVITDRYRGCVTTFRVKFDAGLGNSISIRGNQSPLSWQSGQLAHWTPGSVWVADVRGLNGAFDYKTLINDQNWESTQGNHTGTACQVNEITPKF